MPQPKPWLKMWTEWVHDAKMLSLTLAEQGAWWRLVTLAQECDAEGHIIKGNGCPLTVDEMCTCLHIQSSKDRQVFQSMIDKMNSQKSLEWHADTLVVVNFAERQSTVPSATKQAVRERVRRYRERQRETEKLLPPLTTPSITEGEGEGEQSRAEGNAVTAVTPEAILAEIVKFYESEIGLISPIFGEKLKDFAENYQGPVEWIRDAFAEAARHNARNWAYVEAVLDRWQREGRHREREEKPRKQHAADGFRVIKSH